jgi:site-specific recombinase XerD
MVDYAIRQAYERIGLGYNWAGPHVLRHTVATIMHQKGATLKEVADVLGHKTINSTVTYTKLNLPALAKVALPWPEVEA